MTCTTCGRENPPHLTFCQECGQRLGPRIAPPTPPIGLGAQEPTAAEAFAAKPRVATQLGAIAAAPVPPPPAPAASPAAAAHAGGERRCKVCDTPNGAALRYCTSCGSTLEPAPVAAPPPRTPPPPPPPVAPAPIAAPPPAAPIAAQPMAPAAVPITPISPVRVLGLGAPPADAARTCARCRGTADPGAQFCKFCGASLADAAPAAAPPPPPAPSPGLARSDDALAPMLPHERLELPRANGRASAAPAPPPAAAPAPAPPAPAPPAPAPAAPGPAAPVASAARSPVRGRIVVIAKSGADGPSYPIGDTLDIGRLEGNVVVGEDPYLSPRHVRIAWEGGKLVLRDLGSTNGVFLRLAAVRDMNAPRRVPPDAQPGEVAVPLEDQDLILVGQQVLRFEVVKDGEAGLGPAVEHGTLLFGSPASPRYARLGQRTVEGVTRDVYYLRKMETVLGRESGDVVFTEDPFLSRRHAAIRLLGPNGAALAAGSKPQAGDVRFALVDLGSSNGTFLRVRGDVELSPGDHFRVGQQLFRVDLDANDGGRAG